jgi:lysophospholipase L1-like esterase
MAKTVVFLGDSITQGQISANYVNMLAGRFPSSQYRLINYGINNDTTYNLLRRLWLAVARRPDVVIILIGTNDVIASLSPVKAAGYFFLKRLFTWPTLSGAYSNLMKIIRRLKDGTTARIALASIPVLGEDFSSRPMRKVQEYNKNIKAIARMENIAYLPVFERQRDYLISRDGAARQAYTGSVLPTAQLAIKLFFTGASFDSYSREMGYTLLTDGVHMNTIGATLIVEVISDFLECMLAEDQQVEIEP